VSILKEICHCGHDKATHWECKSACLGSYCDCCLYVHRDDPDCSARTKTIAPPPSSTDPIFDAFATPVVHSPWCLCPDCCPTGLP